MHVTKSYPQAHDLMYFFHNENRFEIYVIYELSNHFSPAFQTRSTPPSSVYYGEPSEALQNRVRFGCTMPAKRNIRGTFMYTKLTATSVINIQRNTQHCRSNINNTSEACIHVQTKLNISYQYTTQHATLQVQYKQYATSKSQTQHQKLICMYKPNGTSVMTVYKATRNVFRCNTNHTQHQKSVNKSKRNTRGEKTATQVSKAASGHYKATIHINCKTQLPRFRIYLSIDASNTQHRQLHILNFCICSVIEKQRMQHSKYSYLCLQNATHRSIDLFSERQTNTMQNAKKFDMHVFVFEQDTSQCRLFFNNANVEFRNLSSLKLLRQYVTIWRF